MTTRMNESKQQIIKDFNSRANYDNEFRYHFASFLVELAQLKLGQKVLDVATGTGIVAIAAAKIVGNAGSVLGVDISPGMLAQARRKVEIEKLQNIELIEADADNLNFDDNSFDVIFCSAAIVYLTDILASLRQWYCFLKPGGIVAFSCFADTAHTASILFREKAQQFGITVDNPNEPLGTPEKCQALLQQAGFQKIEVVTQQFGFYFKDAETAWNAHANNVYGYQVCQLPPDKLAQLKAEYMAEIHALSPEQGFGHDVNSLFVFARKS
ncbi:MAG: 2-methoxy-6-polyprenyl-1,4-benzoquinol methylase, mitochondrial [Chroococcidiopsis sp. SAG 2025]|uniref:class I SAM-dependent methyltransferase n=1 Tax=Chroococcidiopsis sp. SAG 2025 TaxID=171389 RepID=UPI002936E4F7|nr:class I SAM-dependent methyltransferase [Chroococcidiopsis sp. SAG 2025]MDV2992798.1 2-methoxy-6-polyprenyl-1,4-benzoquinol methylase, mitochondrial [Chroococcidiopsis sp. SAG 2025]